MPILTAHFLSLVYRHFMTFSLFSAGHIVSVFPLVLKADNIESFFKTTNLNSPQNSNSPSLRGGMFIVRKSLPLLPVYISIYSVKREHQAFIFLKKSLLSLVSAIFSRMNSMHSIGFLSARYFLRSHVLESSS